METDGCTAQCTGVQYCTVLVVATGVLGRVSVNERSVQQPDLPSVLLTVLPGAEPVKM